MAYGQYRKDYLIDRSYRIALKVAGAYKRLTIEKEEFILSNLLLRSCTSVGAKIAEAGRATTESDFVERLSEALKETADADYVLSRLRNDGYLTPDQADPIIEECGELQSLLESTIIEAKRKAA